MTTLLMWTLLACGGGAEAPAPEAQAKAQPAPVAAKAKKDTKATKEGSEFDWDKPSDDWNIVAAETTAKSQHGGQLGRLGPYTAEVTLSGGTMKVYLVNADGSAEVAERMLRVEFTPLGGEPVATMLDGQGTHFEGALPGEMETGGEVALQMKRGAAVMDARIAWSAAKDGKAKAGKAGKAAQ
jgi:hypothetical protein